MIKRIMIDNFRSIKHLEVEPTSLCALVGPNSVGKSTILKALDLVLGESWTTKAKVSRDLFNDVTNPITIEVDFDEPIIYDNPKWGYQEVNNIILKMLIYPYVDVNTEINHGDKFYYQDNFKKVCQFIYIPANRDLSDELRVSQWTLLGKMMRLIQECYLKKYDNDEDKLKSDFAEKIRPAKEFLEANFDDNGITFSKFAQIFNSYCERNNAGLASNVTPLLNIYNLNWFYKTLQINIKEDYSKRDFDSEEVGSGMQNLLFISIFQTYAELLGKKVIFGIEEPENFLYPNAQRSLYRSFRELSNNSQIFYTTHNPNFVNAEFVNEIQMLQKTDEKGTIVLKKDKDILEDVLSENHKFKIYSHFNRERNELFFARKIIFVEGNSDKILITTICEERWNLDLDRLGVVIIECGGKSGVNYFVGICHAIGIENYLAVWDQDQKNSYNPRIDWLNQINDKGIEIPGNLEKYCCIQGSNDASKIENAYKWAVDPTNVIPTLIDKIRIFITNQNSELIDLEGEEKYQFNETESDEENFDDEFPF